MQGIRLEVEKRQLELDKLTDNAGELTELSGGQKLAASSVAHTRCRYDALTAAVVVSDWACLYWTWINYPNTGNGIGQFGRKKTEGDCSYSPLNLWCSSFVLKCNDVWYFVCFFVSALYLFTTVTEKLFPTSSLTPVCFYVSVLWSCILKWASCLSKGMWSVKLCCNSWGC